MATFYIDYPKGNYNEFKTYMEALKKAKEYVDKGRGRTSVVMQALTEVKTAQSPTVETRLFFDPTVNVPKIEVPTPNKLCECGDPDCDYDEFE